MLLSPAATVAPCQDREAQPGDAWSLEGPLMRISKISPGVWLGSESPHFLKLFSATLCAHIHSTMVLFNKENWEQPKCPITGISSVGYDTNFS